MQTNKTVYDWEDHKQQNCPICSPPPLKAGRHKKKPNMGGRPKNISYQGAIKHVKAIASPPISNYNTLVTDTPPDYQCTICLDLLHQPIELTVCRTYICASCCCEWLRQSECLLCPCCPDNHMGDYSTIKGAPDIVLTALSSLMVTCNLCNKNGFFKDLDNHVISQCTAHFTWSECCNDILGKTQESPLTPLEERVQSSLLRRSLTNSTSPTLKVKTRGQVCTLYTILHKTHPKNY